MEEVSGFIALFQVFSVRTPSYSVKILERVMIVNFMGDSFQDYIVFLNSGF